VERCARAGSRLELRLPRRETPTVFMPVSPPPYMNGGPRDFLSWVIECKDAGFNPEACAEWLEGRLPRPVNELERWKIADDE